MNLVGFGLGYREVSRVADFIRQIENGNENFGALIDNGEDVNIGYDLHADEVTIDTCNLRFYPADLDIIY